MTVFTDPWVELEPAHYPETALVRNGRATQWRLLAAAGYSFRPAPSTF